MREELMEWLVSPGAREPLTLEVYETTEGTSGPEIWAGRLASASGEEYPIVESVPRLLAGESLARCLRRYPGFVAKHGERFAGSGSPWVDPHGSIKARTQESFGEQWNLYPEILEEWRENFREYLSPHIQTEDLAGKSVLDCGCGFGRHLYQAAQAGATPAIGIDLSHAVDACARNVARFRNAHVVQADIYHMPLRGGFDLAYCIGVLQHLPDPASAMRGIAGQVRPGGILYAWVYGPRPLAYHLVVDTLRHLTTRLRPRALHGLSFVLALFSYSAFALPRRALEMAGLRRLGALVPFSRYARYPFRVSHADWHDRLSAPKTCYFSQEEATALLDAARCAESRVTFRMGGSWKLWGRMGPEDGHAAAGTLHSDPQPGGVVGPYDTPAATDPSRP